MKKIFATIFAVLAIVLSLNAQDARQRTVETIVGDVLNEMPAQNAAAQASAMLDIAKSAPRSIELLAGKLQSADKGSNNLIEYALNGIANFAVAPGNEAYKDAILEGLKAAAAAAPDKYNKQFLETQIRLLGKAENTAPEAEVDAAALLAQAKTLAKSKLSKDRNEALYLTEKALGYVPEKTLLKAIKGNDDKLRGNALRRYAPVTGEFAAKVAKAFNSYSDRAKTDVLNWMGDNKIATQAGLIASQVAGKGQVAAAAIEAAGKIVSPKTVNALIGQLGGENAELALKALKSYPANLSDNVAEALNTADGTALDNLIELARAKRLTNCGDKIYELASDGNKAALDKLYGIATVKDLDKLAKLVDNASPATVGAYTNAFQAAVKTLSPDDQFSSIKNIIDKAVNKERFYNALAMTGTNDAVKELDAAYRNGSEAAVKALALTRNRRALPALLIPAQKGDQAALDTYVDFAEKYQDRLDDRCEAFCNALKLTNDKGRINNIIRCLGTAPTPKAFDVVKNYLDDKDYALTAARSIKDIAIKSTEELDDAAVNENLGKAANIFQTIGSTDDVYAIDEIKKFLADKKDVSPIFTLSDEEKAAGFEMLFDGTNLDKWEGNLEGYKVVNNVIQVTSGFGGGGNLYTKKEYRDFVFRFEFCFSRDGANNGVGVRTPHGVDAAYGGMCEVQVLDHDSQNYAGWLAPYQVHGSVYGVIPAKRIKHKPLGEWGEEEIRVEGTHIKVTVNGEVIVDGDIKEACQGHNVAPDGSDFNPYTADRRNHPGMFNETGYIGFLGHGSGVKFRNVRVLDLTPAPTPKKAKRK